MSAPISATSSRSNEAPQARGVGNVAAFHAAAKSLRASGYAVVNHAELDAQDTGPMTWEDYIRRDIKALMDCTHIAMLPQWEKSRGAKLEKHIAEALGMSVIFLTVSA